METFWKVMDPRTGLFYIKRSWGYSLDSTLGTVFKRRRDLTASLNGGGLSQALRERPSLVVVELVVEQQNETPLGEWKKRNG